MAKNSMLHIILVSEVGSPDCPVTLFTGPSGTYVSFATRFFLLPMMGTLFLCSKMVARALTVSSEFQVPGCTTESEGREPP